MAIIHYKLKQTHTAIRFAQQALSMREELYGSSTSLSSSSSNGHVDLADTLSLMGILNYEREEYNSSLNFSNRAYEMRKRLYPDGHLKIANSLYNLGLVYNKLGDEHKSTECLAKSYEMKKSYNEKKTGLFVE